MDLSRLNLTPEQAAALVAELNASGTFRRAQTAPDPVPATENLAVLGIGYTLGTGQLPPPPMRMLAQLSAIGSPLLGRPDAMRDMDAYRALYAVWGGPEALRPIMACAQRRERLETLKPDEDANDARYRVWLERCDAVESETWGAFDAAAMEFADRYGPVSPVEIVEAVCTAMRDLRAGLDMIPATVARDGVPVEAEDADDTAAAEKKTASLPARIWRAFWLCLRLSYTWRRASLTRFPA